MKKISRPKPIEFEIEDAYGNKAVLSCKSVTSAMYERITQTYNKTGEEEKNIFLINREQMAIIFGGIESDYLNYDQRVIKQVLDGFNEEMRGPIQPQE